jgi:amino acid permease
MKENHSKETKSVKELSLGTFTGVFVPNVLTILGVILFLRVGWVVGEVGLMHALSILLIANSVTLLTTLSLSAIATSAKVGRGGAYFMISRSLGLEVGGSIGVPLFFAQAVSVAFYAIGFSESLLSFFPELNVHLAASAVITLLFALTWISSSIAFKAQNVIFVLLILSLGSFFLGSSPDGLDHSAANYAPLYSEGVSFWVVFAIFSLR